MYKFEKIAKILFLMFSINAWAEISFEEIKEKAKSGNAEAQINLMSSCTLDGKTPADFLQYFKNLCDDDLYRTVALKLAADHFMQIPLDPQNSEALNSTIYFLQQDYNKYKNKEVLVANILLQCINKDFSDQSTKIISEAESNYDFYRINYAKCLVGNSLKNISIAKSLLQKDKDTSTEAKYFLGLLNYKHSSDLNARSQGIKYMEEAYNLGFHRACIELYFIYQEDPDFKNAKKAALYANIIGDNPNSNVSRIHRSLLVEFEDGQKTMVIVK